LSKIKLALAIRALNIGGAERQFLELAKNIDKSKFDVVIYTMYEGPQDNIARELENVKFIHLKKKNRYDNVTFFRNYIKSLKEEKPDVIYSFLSEMNLFSLWTRKFLNKKHKVVWGFRASDMDLKKYGKFPQLLFWLQKKFSPNVDKIIANSHASVKFHKNMGFNVSKATVVHNGINVDRFKPSDEERVTFRKEHGLNDDDIALGIVSRVSYMKGYPILAKSMKKLMSEYPNVRLFAVGGGEEAIKQECIELLGEYNERVTWFGEQKSVESNFFNGLDIYTSSSVFGEGFSNSIAEAMCCELPIVATKVGDSHIVVGDTGNMVKSEDVDSLYQGIKEMIESDYKSKGKLARERIVENFSTMSMIKNSERELGDIVS
jgi:glycosyltransferase involved in cell wall biosynthesis